MIPLNINFLKSQPTIADLNKVVKEAQSPIKLQLDTARGEKVLGSDTSKILPSLPRTDILSQININKVKNTRTAKADVFRNLGIEIL